MSVQFCAEVRTPVLAVRTSDSWRELEGVPVQVTDSRATFRVCLPLDTRELEAFLRGKQGSTRVLPGQLIPGMPRPAFRIQLDPTESVDIRERRREMAGGLK